MNNPESEVIMHDESKIKAVGKTKQKPGPMVRSAGLLPDHKHQSI
jgi:hypothetical protein